MIVESSRQTCVDEREGINQRLHGEWKVTQKSGKQNPMNESSL